MTLLGNAMPAPSTVARSSLNICIISSESRAGTGGLAAYNRMLAKHLAMAGCKVTSVARFDRAVPEKLDYSAGNSVAGNTVDAIAIRLIEPRGWAKRLLPRIRHLTGRLFLRGFAPTLYSAAYRRSLSAAIDLDVDVIHYIGTGWELLGFTALREARRRGAVFTIWPAVHAGTWGDSPLDIALYQQADAVFCQSDHELEHLAKLGVDHHRLTRAWLAPATGPTGNGERFRSHWSLGDRQIVLFIARKSRSKGFHTLCDSMMAVLESNPAACLVAIGPDGDEPYPTLPAGAYLNLGVATDDEKADALAACDVFCMPSDAESFGIVYVEAWSYGKPVIGGPAEAVKELIEHKTNGLYLQDQTSWLLTRMLNQLLGDQDLRRKLGLAGYRLQQMKYNWAEVLSLHEKCFEKIRQDVLRR